MARLRNADAEDLAQQKNVRRNAAPLGKLRRRRVVAVEIGPPRHRLAAHALRPVIAEVPERPLPLPEREHHLHEQEVEIRMARFIAAVVGRIVVEKAVEEMFERRKRQDSAVHRAEIREQIVVRHAFALERPAAEEAAEISVEAAGTATANAEATKAAVKTEAIETKAGKAKAIETKKDTTKAIETRAAVLKDPEPAAEEPKKTAAKKAAPKKTTAKTTAVKRTTKKAELKTELFLQFSGKEYSEKEVLQKVKEVWTKELKNKVGDMKDVKIYLKPEEFAAYYVINGDTTGKVDL